MISPSEGVDGDLDRREAMMRQVLHLTYTRKDQR